MRSKLGLVVVIALLVIPQLVAAQGINATWNRWDAQINVQANDQLQVAETQEIRVNSGTLHGGDRTWTQPVQVQSIFVNLNNSQTPQSLKQGNGQPGTYKVAQSGNDKTTLSYELPSAQNAGDTFIVQINYNAQSLTTGMVDLDIVPADHPFPVNSSTIRISFPSGQTPDPSLARVSTGNGTAQIVGNDLVIASQSPISNGEAFGIQVPYGAGVGAANNNPNSNPAYNPSNPNGSSPYGPANQPANGTDTGIQLPGFGTILLLICGAALLLLFGGGAILRNLLGGFLGGGNSGGTGINPFGGSNQGPFGGSNQNPYQGSNSESRGFRPSANQNREIGNIRNDKDSGGSAGFH